MDNIPHGWRLGSSSDIAWFTQQAQKEISTNTKDKLWGISELSDGRIHGRGYGYDVVTETSTEWVPCAEKLIIKGTYILWRTHNANQNIYGNQFS